MSQIESNPGQPTARPWIFVFRIVIALLVIAALIYTFVGAASQLKDSRFSVWQLDWGWVALAIVAYIGAMSLSGLFWHQILIAMNQRPSLRRSMLAFFTSQLGKYVPGKAMVVIVRTDMIRGPDVETGPAAASVFVETLTWIFVGSAIASLLLVFQFRDQVSLGATAVVMTLAAGILTWPPVFRAIARRLTRSKLADGSDVFRGLRTKVMAVGWTLMAIAWCLNGLSLWLVLKSLPGLEISLGDYWLTLACVSLATVAGFVSLMPGGLGVRELVIIPLIGARFGSVTAIVAAVMIRLVWLSAELITSGIIYLVGRSMKKDP